MKMIIQNGIQMIATKAFSNGKKQEKKTMNRIDTKPPHGHTTTIPHEQFMLLMYDIAETMHDMDSRSDGTYPEGWYSDEAESVLVRNGIIKGE